MRIQSFEFGDLPKIPKFYHNFLRTLMSRLYELFKIHQLWIPHILAFCKENESTVIMDPCAGSGKVNQLIESEIQKDVNIQFILSDIMTDRAPMFADHINGLRNKRLQYISHSIDFLKSQNEYKQPKMFINSFHHFTNDQVIEILKASSQNSSNLLILEYCRKTFMSFISMILGPFIAMILFPIVVKKNDLIETFIFMYLIPIIPMMLLWDGVISSLRTYDKDDIENLLKRAGIDNYEITYSSGRSLLYPSGVTAMSIKFN